jgi:transcriptional regulator with XRE-family HTH domain
MGEIVTLAERATVGRRLAHGAGRRVRVAAGFSTRQLAGVIGVDAAQLSRWERGLSLPRPSAAARWLDAVEALRKGLDSQVPDTPRDRA